VSDEKRGEEGKTNLRLLRYPILNMIDIPESTSAYINMEALTAYYLTALSLSTLRFVTVMHYVAALISSSLGLYGLFTIA
jgi:hypothetical protein